MQYACSKLRYTEKCNREIPRAFVEIVLLTPKPRDKGLLKAAMDAIWDLPRHTLSLRDPKTSCGERTMGKAYPDFGCQIQDISQCIILEGLVAWSRDSELSHLAIISLRPKCQI